MKMKSTLLFLVLLELSACKNVNQTAGPVKLPFDSRPYTVNSLTSTGSSLRKKLLHEVYLSQRESMDKNVEQVSEKDLEAIKDDSNLNNNFAKLIVSYADKEELFYIPEGIKKEEVVSLLSLRLEQGKSWIWKSNLLKAKTSYLIEASSQEVLENEKSFSTMTTSKLEMVYPFQVVEISLQVSMATPTFREEYFSACGITFSVNEIRGNKRGEMSRIIPSGDYSSFGSINKENLEGEVKLGDNQSSILFHSENGSLRARFSPNETQIDVQIFSLHLPESESKPFISNVNDCTGANHYQVFPTQNKLQYTMDFKVFGVRETLESFGKLPVQI
jgi:hypothetical protein